MPGKVKRIDMPTAHTWKIWFALVAKGYYLMHERRNKLLGVGEDPTDKWNSEPPDRYLISKTKKWKTEDSLVLLNADQRFGTSPTHWVITHNEWMTSHATSVAHYLAELFDVEISLCLRQPRDVSSLVLLRPARNFVKDDGLLRPADS